MFNSTDLPIRGFNTLGVLRRNRLLFTVVGLHVLGGIAVSMHLGMSFWAEVTPRIWGASRILSMFMIANFLLWRLAVAIFVSKPQKPIQWMIADIREFLSNRTHVSDALAGYFSVIVLIVTFSYLKDEIPSVNPYSWDPVFAQFDRFLHGGHDPWTLIWPILSSPYVTTLINMAYHFWFILIYMAVCLACIDRRDPNRSMTFLVAFALCWSVGGNLMAMIFSSVGPVYYQMYRLWRAFTNPMKSVRFGLWSGINCCWMGISTTALCAEFLQCPACMSPQASYWQSTVLPITAG